MSVEERAGGKREEKERCQPKRPAVVLPSPRVSTRVTSRHPRAGASCRVPGPRCAHTHAGAPLPDKGGSRGANHGARAPPARAPRSPQLQRSCQQQGRDWTGSSQEGAAAQGGRGSLRGMGETPCVAPTGATTHPRRRPRPTVRGRQHSRAKRRQGVWRSGSSRTAAEGEAAAPRTKGSLPAARPRAPCGRPTR